MKPMKTKVSQKEWNDKRDAFLCAIIQSKITDEFYPERWINDANQITSELYEIGEKLDLLAELDKQRFHHINKMNEERLKAEELTVIKGEPNTIDTRPFNTKVVEIFNQYLPKEIAPLAIEAHKRSVEHHQNFNVNVKTLEGAIRHCLHWNVSFELGRFNNLHLYTKGNTITATPEQLREWFPLAYEGGENV